MLSYKESIQLDQIYQERSQDIQDIQYLLHRLKQEHFEMSTTITCIERLLKEIV